MYTNKFGWACMEIRRTNWINNSMETKHEETQKTTKAMMVRQNKGRPKDMGVRNAEEQCVFIESHQMLYDQHVVQYVGRF